MKPDILSVFTHPGIIEEEKAQKKGKIRSSHIGMLVVLFVVILASFGYYWFEHIGASIGRLRVEKIEGIETFAKDGSVFLIRGSVYNGSTKSRAFVMLKAKLFDAAGTVLNERADIAGIQLSKAEIQKMNKEDIETKLALLKKVGDGSFVLKSRKTIPFTIVFLDTFPGKLKSYQVGILEAQKQ
jgi:hypothetical protein